MLRGRDLQDRLGAFAPVEFDGDVFRATRRGRLGESLRLGRAELIGLNVDWDHFGSPDPERTQEIGAAVTQLKYDGLIAPSARWACDNVMVSGNILERQAACRWRNSRGNAFSFPWA
jgi:hypothetical protein